VVLVDGAVHFVDQADQHLVLLVDLLDADRELVRPLDERALRGCDLSHGFGLSWKNVIRKGYSARRFGRNGMRARIVK
jgi:hypothetical protein